MEEISQILKKQKNLEVISDIKRNGIDLGFALCIHVQDENKKQFSLLSNHQSNQQDLHRAKIKAKYLKSLCHPSIAQYVDDFTIGDYYFIQIERISQCLFNWINEKESGKSIRELHYVELAIQMLEVTFYLNKSKCFLSLSSMLSCFAFDEEMNVKLIHFVSPETISIPEVKSTFNQCRERKELFFYQQDILKMDNQCKVWQVSDHDLWAVGICLYYLSGASVSHILNYIIGEESYQFSQILGFQNNVILYTIICGSHKLISPPSITRLIGSFQIQYRKLQENGQSNEKTFEAKVMNKDDQDKINQIEEDIQTYQKIRKEIYDQNIEKSQNEIMNELIAKYGLSDTILQLQIKHAIHLNDLDEAAKLSEQMKEMNPLSDTAIFFIGKICEMKGDIKEAIRFYMQSLEINPLDSDNYMSIGILYDEIESLESFKYYRQAIEINANNGIAHSNLGLNYADYELYQQSILAIKIAIRLDNKEIDFYFNLACQYEEISQFEKAIKAQKQATNLEESDQNLNVLKVLKSNL